MRDECRSCRFWHPLEDWERDPDCEGYAHCGYSPAVDWPVDDMGRHEPPFPQAGHWCQFWERFLGEEQESDVWRCLEALADRLIAIEKLNQARPDVRYSAKLRETCACGNPECSAGGVPDVAGLVENVIVAYQDGCISGAGDVAYNHYEGARQAIDTVAEWLKSKGLWSAHDLLRRELGE